MMSPIKRLGDDFDTSFGAGVNCPGSYVRDVNTKATCFVLHLQVMLDCIGAQCGWQEAWTTVDPALIRGLVPHDQGSSRGFICLANAHRHQACTNPDRGFPNLPILPSALGVEDCPGVAASPPCWPSPSCRRRRHANLGSTIRAMAQMNPTSSRAIATTTLGAGLPAAMSLRQRAESRTCAFQATLRISS